MAQFTPPSLLRASQEPPRKPTYTTVGSLYNPTSTPLQPPLRRGRALRLQNTIQSDRALPKSGLSVMSGLSPSASQGAAASSAIQHYSPLQQNQDRAVSPLTDRADGGPPAILNDRDMSTLPPPGLRPPPSCFPVAAGHDRYGHATQAALDYDLDGDEQDDEEEDDAALPTSVNERVASQFNMRALANLASYSNPMTKIAKMKIESPRPALGVSANPPRPQLAASPAEDRVAMPRALRSTAYSFLSETDFAPELGAGVEPAAREGLFGQQHQLSHAHHRGSCMAPGNCAFKSALATGPGAPQPLTAGPPGQRQYKAPTFISTIKALREGSLGSVHPPEEEIEESYVLPPIGYGRPQKGADGQRAAGSQAGNPVSASKDQGPVKLVRRVRKYIVDTLPPEALGQYFPERFPPDLGKQYKPLMPGPTAQDPFNLQTPHIKSPEEIALANAKTNADFYAGTDALGKSWEVAITEAQRRRADKLMGLHEAERRERRCKLAASLEIGDDFKTEYPHLSVEEASLQPVAEHAAPLLNMVFANMLSYYEDNGSKGVPSGFEKSDPSLIDDSVAGRSSFWGCKKKKTDVKRKTPRRRYELHDWTST